MATITLKKLTSMKRLAILPQCIKARNDVYAIDTGKDLLRGKKLLARGNFGPWLKKSFGWSPSTANNYMNAAKLAGEHPAVANLMSAAMIALAAPSTPDVVKSEVIADLEKGTKQLAEKIDAAVQAVTDLDLVKRLKVIGIDATIAMVEAGFPGANLMLSLDQIATEGLAYAE